MNFADEQQRKDFCDACGRLTHASTRLTIQQAGGTLTLAELWRWIAELRNAEQVLVSIYAEREEAAGVVYADTIPPGGGA